MAKFSHDREDLLREATALVERIELRADSYSDPIVIGLRRDGAGAIYIGADPVYQFNTRGELRRAYRQGRLLKAEQGRLVELSRQRAPNEVVLVRRELTDQQSDALLSEMSRHVSRLAAMLDTGAARVTGQVPAGEAVAARIRCWLADMAQRPAAVAKVPNVR